MKYQNIIVTGGAGFIGSNFVRYIKRQYPNVTITILDKLTYASSFSTISDLLDERVQFYQVDIADYHQLEKVITNEHDLIVHFAAESFNDRSLTDTESFVQTNVLGTHHLLELARKYQLRFHQISTDEVYGDFPIESKEKFTEETQYQPSSPYSATKASADLLVKAWVRSFGVQATISNCSNNYGPYQNPEKFIPRQIINILKQEKPVLYGNGLNVRDWIHVEDHCRAIDLIIDKGNIGETYLVGIDNERNNLEVLQRILVLLGKEKTDFEFIEDRPGHDRRYGINAHKLYEELGYQPLHTQFEEELKQVIDWYQNNTAWWSELEDKKRGIL